jgi:hypothetical protein
MLKAFPFPYLGEMTDHGDGGLTEGPREVDASDLVAGGSDAFSGRGLLAFDEAGIGSKSLDRREATDVMDFIEKGEGEDLSDARHGVQAKQGLRVMDPGLPDDGLFEITDEFVVGVAKGEIGLHALLEHGIVEGVGNRFPLVLVDEAPGGPGQVVLMEGVLDVGHELGPLADEVGSAPEEVPGGPHLGGIDVGHGKEASPEQTGGLEGVDAVVLGLAPMDGLHVQGVAEDEGDGMFGTEVSEPVPVEDAFGGDDQVVPKRLYGLKESSAITGQVLVKQDIASGVQNAQIESAGMKVDAAVMLMLLGIEAHGSPPGLDDWSHSHRASRCLGGPGGGLYQYQKSCRLRSFHSLQTARHRGRAGNF